MANYKQLILTNFDLLAAVVAPQIIDGHNTSSTTIRVTWKAMPVQNGIIVSYSVYYQAIGGSYSDSTKRYKQVGSALTQADLTGLEVYVLYNITVTASTSAGEGPSSIAIAVRTAEAGKIINCHKMKLCIIFGRIINLYEK